MDRQCTTHIAKLNGITHEHFRNDKVEFGVVGVDPGLGGKESDEAHVALLKLESGDVVCIGGCIIPSEAPIIRPFVHIATLVELIRYVDSFLATNVQTNKKWLMVVVESNLATMGSIYFQYIRLMFSNLQDVLVNSKLVFPGEIQSSPAASPISQRIGIYVNSRTKYKAWIVYVAALCECMLHDGGIRRITALTREVCCQLMSRGQFRLNTYFYDGISLLRLADAQRSETVEVDIGRQQAARIPDLSKDKAKDDLYMAMTNTLWWVDTLLQRIPDVRTRNDCLQEQYDNNTRESGRMQHVAASLSSPPITYNTSRHNAPAPDKNGSVLLHYTAMASVVHRCIQQIRKMIQQHCILLYCVHDDNPEPIQGIVMLKQIYAGCDENENRRQQYQARYGVECYDRHTPRYQYWRRQLVQICQTRGLNLQSVIADYTTSHRSITFCDARTGRPWMSCAKANKSAGSMNCTEFLSSKLDSLQPVLDMATRVHDEFGAHHTQWSATGSSNILAQVIHQCIQYCRDLTKLTADLTTNPDPVPISDMQAAKMCPKSLPSFTVSNHMYNTYFRVLAIEKFVDEVYVRHRHSLLTYLGNNNPNQQPFSPEPFSIRIRVKDCKRTAYQDAVHAYADAETYDPQLGHRNTFSRIYTPTMLS